MRISAKLTYCFYLLMGFVTATVLGGCSDNELIPGSDPGEIETGEQILFTSYLPEVAATRAAKDDFQTSIKNSYKAVGFYYDFKVRMFQEGNSQALGEADYVPTRNAADDGFAEDGTLAAKDDNGLYWLDNVNRYGFEAFAGTENLEADQHTQELLIKQDKLHGYSYEPTWDDANSCATDNINAVNFRTNKEWYQANQQVYQDYHQMPIATDEYKKIPLFLSHERALITVILKAGEGVERAQLKHATSEENIQASIFSYDSTSELEINALPEETTIDYLAGDYGGAASGVETMKYHAVVEPYNYLDPASVDSKPICRINLSGQKFSYYASNDKEYNAYQSDVADGTGTLETAAGIRVDKAYNLQAGKHLIIEATLSRESRKILITAYVEDWTDKITTTICDDYGKNGDPDIIKTREDLLAFLDNPNKNKAGSVAIISPTMLDLEKTITTDAGGNVTSSTPNPWPAGKELNCMLNLAGSVLYTEHELFSKISASGNLVNGKVVLRNATVTAAITDTNEGTIDHVDVEADGAAKTTKGGLANVNYGTIYECSSNVPVYAADGYVGGIAAQSVHKTGATKYPVISNCVVRARVDGDSSVTAGGGIVGYANGRVSGNTFEYGITVLQDSKFANIIGASAQTTENVLTAESNAWPTTLANTIAGTNVNENAIYTGIIDSQKELAYVLTTSSYNTSENKILIANDFVVETSTVPADSWELGKQDDTTTGNNGNLFFMLEGNNKVITLKGTKTVVVDGQSYATAPMLFTNIQNSISNLTLVLEESLIAAPSTGVDNDGNTTYTGIDAIAPLGYAVCKNGSADVVLSNIKVKVKEGKYIQAAMPGGIVAWAYGGVVFDRCEVDGTIQTWLPASIGDQDLRYAGGMAALAEVATFTQCMFHTSAVNFQPVDAAHRYVYAGGIIGGVARKVTTSSVTPSVIIKDCASQFPASVAKQGALVGNASYQTGSTGTDQEANGLKSDECVGNWWGQSARAVGHTYNNMTDAKAVGVRNSVQPAFNPILPNE